MTVRQEVKASIIGVMSEAEKAGRCPLAAAEAAFPGVPIVVVGACYGEMISDQEDRWWQTVERVIDGELVQRAVASAAAQ
ncbi:hypothetical protein [Methylobacterium sp. E-066]|uniref:hypothetical protein n=1 Tax=Methylobacterium sp. E-066 TaxID=2836584 RepID=UPI001FBBC111|nr:hypothetical protein [Methylobacterium sp. E-066]MCJ2142170.1 hypothetical protein [Methylobacterium sp. E-066]